MGLEVLGGKGLLWLKDRKAKVLVWKLPWHCKHIFPNKLRCLLGVAGVLMKIMVQGLECPWAPLLTYLSLLPTVLSLKFSANTGPALAS